MFLRNELFSIQLIQQGCIKLIKIDIKDIHNVVIF